MEMKDVVTSVLNIIGPAFLEQVRGGERFESYVNRWTKTQTLFGLGTLDAFKFVSRLSSFCFVKANFSTDRFLIDRLSFWVNVPQLFGFQGCFYFVHQINLRLYFLQWRITNMCVMPSLKWAIFVVVSNRFVDFFFIWGFGSCFVVQKHMLVLEWNKRCFLFFFDRVVCQPKKKRRILVA